MGAYFHLAQLNIAHLLAPLDSPQLADFVGALDRINTLAEGSAGFVWRLRGTADFPDLGLVNLSVWDSVEALKAFTYLSDHVEIFRRRAEWFERPTQAHMVLWWIPAGHEPTVEEAAARLRHLREHGPGPLAFTFAQPSEMPVAPEALATAAGIQYDGRRFAVAANSDNGDVSPGLVFHYRQSGSRLWCLYGDGVRIRFGALVAAVQPDGALDMRYQHVDAAGEVRTGQCHSRPERMPDGRLRLHERWQWTNGDESAGSSVLEELLSPHQVLSQA
jgi:Domain of unknown function (DUF3291)